MEAKTTNRLASVFYTNHQKGTNSNIHGNAAKSSNLELSGEKKNSKIQQTYEDKDSDRTLGNIQ